ncbi:endonuclease domain-containing 1 protein-like [Silurus meridionalis]|nr:endonuclease domain-containing 1 protein-like [Silurus meridionalis]
MKLFVLVLLISAFSSLSLAKVVQDFAKSDCSEYFIKTPKGEVITPTVFTENNYKQICQHFGKRYRYATLYDTNNRISVYSAYTFIGDITTVRNEEWKNEPQLENSSYNEDMTEITVAEMDKYSHQAVNRDYAESQKNTIPPIEYTRGHLFPNQFAADQFQADSTFAFTNVAPQTQHSNGEWAKQVETPMRREILRECRPSNNNPTYVVTGVVPGNSWISIKRKEKVIDKGVNIPTYYWTAFCCLHNDVRISKGFLSLQNQPDGRTYELSEMSVNILNGRLSKLYNKIFKVFGDLCLN